MAITAHDIVSDSPTNNFATWNALNYKGNSLLDGNLNHYITTTASSYAEEALGTIAFDAANSSIYFETYIKNGDTSGAAGTRTGVGVVPSKATAGTYGDAFSLVGSYVFLGGNSQFYSGTYSTATANVWYTSGTSYGSSFTIGDIVGVFINNGSLYYSINGSWVNSSDGTFANVSAAAKTNMTGYKVPAILTYLNGNNDGQVYLNTGQDPTFGGNKSPTTTYTDANGIGAFYYQPPTGALALCTANLPDFTPTVTGDVPQDYFKAVTYTGSHPTANPVNVGFNPDLIWLKSRTQQYAHGVWDSIRTVNGYEQLSTNNTNAEATSGDAISFITNGFRVNTGQAFNESGQGDDNMVAWCWKAGGPPDLTSSPTKPFAKNGVQYETLSAANITAGTITPTAMSVNTDAGFSIVKYQGILDSNTSTATIPHGLASADFCIIKNLDNANTWVVSHTSITPNVMALQDAGAAASTPPVDATYGQITSLNSNTVTITRGSTRGDNVGENLNSWGYIMYCWHSVDGYSKCGSYIGNGSPDGPFVYTGFRPAFILLKNTDNSGAWWLIIDAQRSPYNVVDDYLYPNDPAVESSSSGDSFDFLSNGFKPRGTGGGANGSGNKIIFMAFSEQPFKFSNAR